MLKTIWRAAADRIAIRIASRLIAAQSETARNEARRDPPGAPYALPDNFSPLHLRDEAGRGFIVARAEPPGEYERGLMEGQDWGTASVRRVLRRLLGDDATLLDVGANVGCVALPIARDGTRVIAVEMLPTNVVKLQLARLANALPHLQIVQAGASSQDGLLRYGGEHAWGTVGQGTQGAIALKLDTVLDLAELSAPVRGRLVVKLDVEGHEFDVLLGAKRIIARHRPAILFESIEYTSHGDDQTSKRCKTFLADQGYRLFMIFGEILVPRTAADIQESLDTDFLAIPEEAAGALQAFEVRDLTTAERLAILGRNAAEANAAHRLNAACLIARLARQDPGLDAELLPILRTLEADPNAEVAAAARGAAQVFARY